jgi:hypothetical protein
MDGDWMRLWTNGRCVAEALIAQIHVHILDVSPLARYHHPFAVGRALCVAACQFFSVSTQEKEPACWKRAKQTWKRAKQTGNTNQHAVCTCMAKKSMACDAFSKVLEYSK